MEVCRIIIAFSVHSLKMVIFLTECSKSQSKTAMDGCFSLLRHGCRLKGGSEAYKK